MNFKTISLDKTDFSHFAEEKCIFNQPSYNISVLTSVNTCTCLSPAAPKAREMTSVCVSPYGFTPQLKDAHCISSKLYHGMHCIVLMILITQTAFVTTFSVSLKSVKFNISHCFIPCLWFTSIFTIVRQHI